MLKFPKWQYDDMKLVGVDYKNKLKVQEYDAKMKKARDFKKENTAIVKILELSKDQEVLDLGAGTGEFTIEAAKHCSKVFAVDSSPVMLAYAKEKAEAEQIKNISFLHGSFLTYEHQCKPLDAIITQFALHHLPDFWKGIALKRLHSMLKEGGKIYLKDTVYSFDIKNYETFFSQLICKIRAMGDESAANDIETSISTEYPTTNWIMEGLIRQAGFVIEWAEYPDCFSAHYLCKKISVNS